MHSVLNLVVLLIVTLSSLYAKETTNITLQLKWHDQFQFAGFYMAKEKGYYKKSGLNVKFIEGPNNNVISDVLNQKIDFAIEGSTIAIARSKNKPVVALGVVFQESPLVFITKEEANIQFPYELAGQKIMSIGSQDYMVKAMLYQMGVDPDTIIFAPTSPKLLDDFLDNEIEIYPAYNSDEPYQLREKKVRYHLINPLDYGIHFFGDVLFTSEQLQKKDPELVQKFTEASFKGWHYAFENIEESVKIIHKHYNSTNKSYEFLLNEAKILRNYALYPYVYPGEVNQKRWEEIISIYKKLGYIQNEIDLHTFLFKPDHTHIWHANMLYTFLFTLFIIILLIVSRYKLSNIIQKRTKEIRKINANLENTIYEKTKALNAEKDLLAKLTERYELTLDSAEEGVWDWDITPNEVYFSNEIYFSERWKKMLGYEDAELPNVLESWDDRIHPDDRDKTWEEIYKNINKETKLYENTHRLHHKDGSWVWVLSRGKTIYNNKEVPIRMIGTHTDITRKKYLEDRVKKNEQSLKRAQKIAHLGSWEWDVKQDKQHWSEELYRIVGLRPRSVTPSLLSMLRFVIKKDRKKIIFHIKKMLSETLPHTEFVCRIKTKENIFKYVRIHVEASYENHQVLHAIGSVMDITREHEGEKKRIDIIKTLNATMKLEQEKSKTLSEMTRKLEKSNLELYEAKNRAESATKSKSTFLANMSHEIRTPLNAINGLIALLKEEEKDPLKLKYIEIVDNASHTLLSTINDVLDITKIESGKLEIKKVNFHPYKELMRTAELFQAKAAEKNINLSIDYASNIPEVLYSDILRIKQVINNLLSNAIKFTKENGNILFECTYTSNCLQVTIKDNGIGIAQKKQKDIFDSFTQADSSVERQYGGSGLGLTISAELVKMLKGKLEVKSKEGEGSAFFFSIPVEEGLLKTPESENIDLNELLHGKVLIVEDNKTSQIFVGLVLQKVGVSYDIASDGLEAIEKFKNQTYDLIFMDENMPKLNGRDATAKIRTIEKEKDLLPTPIIALTANALVGDREKFINAGMNDYLSKPVDPNTLITVLHRFLKKSPKQR